MALSAVIPPQEQEKISEQRAAPRVSCGLSLSSTSALLFLAHSFPTSLFSVSNVYIGKPDLLVWWAATSNLWRLCWLFEGSYVSFSGSLRLSNLRQSKFTPLNKVECIETYMHTERHVQAVIWGFCGISFGMTMVSFTMHLQVYQGWKKGRLQVLEPYMIPLMHVYPFLMGFVPLIAGSKNGPISVYCMPQIPFSWGFMVNLMLCCAFNSTLRNTQILRQVYAPLVIHCIFCIAFMSAVICGLPRALFSHLYLEQRLHL